MEMARLVLHFCGGHEHFTDLLLRMIVVVTHYLNIDGGTLLNSALGWTTDIGLFASTT